MRNFLALTGLRLLWLAAGQLGRDLLGFIEDAEALSLSGREAFNYVWRQARQRYKQPGDWLLNLLIEALLAKQLLATGELSSKLNWPER